MKTKQVKTNSLSDRDIKKIADYYMGRFAQRLAGKQRIDRLEQWTKQIADKVGVKLV
ncbi:MAG: hypothetical protein P4L74_00145 [Candidatus Doudnabacteria bacterium]|nr:hypothetical protein [Candidatus Doudnabacteria bacterium]